jgi:3-hydroxyacyl-CoA dehydrogenase/3-hydroxy-2-methylbutyryl-CoA dehydrogenase
MKIEGMTAVVSGGASGLGEACTRYFVEKGANVGILDMAQERGEALAAELGDNAIFCNTNVADTEGVQAAVDTTFETFGAVHTAVSCAGVPYVSKVITRSFIF